MLFFHPVLQAVATVLALHVAWLGIQRFRMSHLGTTVRFDWKRHVKLGAVVIVIWLAGLVGGLAVAQMKWQTVMVTGLHYKVAFAMVPFMAFGMISGLYMDRKKAKGKVLPLLHGAANCIALLLALYQVWTGIWVIRNFIL